MTPSEYKAFVTDYENTQKREAISIITKCVQSEYPEVGNLSGAYFDWSHDTRAVCSVNTEGLTTRYMVNLYTGEVWVNSDDLSIMLQACEKNPDRYSVKRNNECVTVVVWEDTQDPVYTYSEVAITRYDLVSGRRINKPIFRRSFHGEDGDFYCMGCKCIYRNC